MGSKQNWPRNSSLPSNLTWPSLITLAWATFPFLRNIIVQYIANNLKVASLQKTVIKEVSPQLMAHSLDPPLALSLFIFIVYHLFFIICSSNS
jgi:hypothetical protein